MPELANPQEEQFACLLAVGVRQAEAYQRAGWKRDKANASSKAREPRIVQRVAEIQAEEARKEAERRRELGEAQGIDELKRALVGAVGANQWSAAVSAAKALAEMDGSAAPSDHEITVEEIFRRMDQLGPVASCAARMMFVKTSFGPHEPPDSDIELIGRGLSKYLSE